MLLNLNFLVNFLASLNIRDRKLPYSFYSVVLFSILCQGSGALAASNPLLPQTDLEQSSVQPTKVAMLRSQQTIKVKREDLKVQLTQCEREGNAVICTILLSSTKDKVAVWVTDPNRKKSRLIDAEGSEYSTFKVIQFGKSETDLLYIGQTPIKLVLSFNDLPDQLSSIALLEIGLETYGHEVPIQFRKVTVPNRSERVQSSETPGTEVEQDSENL